VFAKTNKSTTIAIRPAVLKPRRDDGSEILRGALQDLGLTDHEAQCYSSICGGGRFSAYEVSNRVGLARPNTYAALKSLVDRGFAEVSEGSPATYRAIDPDQLFVMLELRVAEICMETASALAERFRGATNATDWILEGEDAVEQSVRSSISEARREIWIKATAEHVIRFADILQSAAQSGIQVVLILFDHLPDGVLDGENVRRVPHEGNAHGCSPANRELFSMLVDDSHATIAAYWDGAIAYRVVAPLLLRMTRTFFGDELRLADAMTRHEERISRTFGPGLETLRRDYRPDNMEDARPSGKRSGYFFTRPNVADVSGFIDIPEGLADRMKWFGLTDTESRVFLALIDLPHAATVADIARQTGVSKSNIHGALRALEQKQVVQALQSKPASYQPRAVEELVNTIRTRILRSCRAAAEEARNRAQRPHSVAIQYLDGRPEVLSAFAAGMESSRTDVHILAESALLSELSEDIAAARDRGVTFHILSPEAISAVGGAEVLPDVGTPEEGRLSCMVADMRLAVLASGDDEFGGLATESRCLVFLSQKFLLHRLYLAKLAQNSATRGVIAELAQGSDTA